MQITALGLTLLILVGTVCLAALLWLVIDALE